MERLSHITKLKTQAEHKLHLLSKDILTHLKTKPGPKAFFYYNGYSIERLNNCYDIVRRFYYNKDILNTLYKKERALHPYNWLERKTIPNEVQNILKKQAKVTSLLTLDFESLYIFGGILLDQWALQAICIGNIDTDIKKPFHSLITLFEKNQPGILAPIMNKYFKEMLWLHYQLRYFRNKFIIHTKRPWQRGSSQTFGSYRFHLSTLSPPGWLNDNELTVELTNLCNLIKSSTNLYKTKNITYDSIENLMNNIGYIEDKALREKISVLHGKIGGCTPSFFIVAFQLFEFINLSTELLICISRKNPNKININLT